MRVLITGAAGFIGSALALRLLERGDEVHGIDNLNDYYDVSLKQARLRRCQSLPKFGFHKARHHRQSRHGRLFSEQRFDAVMHLAAQAGVLYSIGRIRYAT